MTQVERQVLIELQVLTAECGPSATYRKLSPELKREARRRMKEREQMTGGLLLRRILELLKIGLEPDRGLQLPERSRVN
jgi:hypothetical protein